MATAPLVPLLVASRDGQRAPLAIFPNPNPRLPELDGLRGLAAVSVVLLHVLLALPHHTVVNRGISYLPGGQAVILFFVLSGYVLSLPFWAGKTVPYWKYALRRSARIYLPFFVAASFSIVGAYCFRDAQAHTTSWFAQTWQTPVTSEHIFNQYLMWTSPAFNTALWSLRFEMQISLIFPLLMLLARRKNILYGTGILLAVAFWNPAFNARWLGWHSAHVTLAVLALFLLGASAARYHHAFERVLRGHRPVRWVVLCASFLLYCTPLLPWKPDYAWLPCAAGATGLILMARVGTRVRRFLTTPVCAYLGEISYSLYLTHSIVLFALTDLLFGRVVQPLLTVLVVVLSMAAAHLFYRGVELPSIWLGRRLTETTGRPYASGARMASVVHLLNLGDG